MTIITDRTAPAVADPRELVSPELFERLVTRLMEEEGFDRSWAERVTDQTLVFLKACADNEGMLSPSKLVDPGLHNFVLHTEDFAEFGERVAGRFLHHRPMMNEDIRSGRALQRTVALLHATGYPVDEELWSGPMSCGSGCVDKVH